MPENTSTSTAPLENLLEFPDMEESQGHEIPNQKNRIRRHSATSSIGISLIHYNFVHDRNWGDC